MSANFGSGNVACQNDTERQLLEKILNVLNGGSTGGGVINGAIQVLLFVSDPNAEGITPSNINSPAMAYSNDKTKNTFNWNTSTHTWQ